MPNRDSARLETQKPRRAGLLTVLLDFFELLKTCSWRIGHSHQALKATIYMALATVTIFMYP